MKYVSVYVFKTIIFTGHTPQNRHIINRAEFLIVTKWANVPTCQLPGTLALFAQSPSVRGISSPRFGQRIVFGTQKQPSTAQLRSVALPSDLDSKFDRGFWDFCSDHLQSEFCAHATRGARLNSPGNPGALPPFPDGLKKPDASVAKSQRADPQAFGTHGKGNRSISSQCPRPSF